VIKDSNFTEFMTSSQAKR